MRRRPRRAGPLGSFWASRMDSEKCGECHPCREFGPILAGFGKVHPTLGRARPKDDFRQHRPTLGRSCQTWAEIDQTWAGHGQLRSWTKIGPRSAPVMPEGSLHNVVYIGGLPQHFLCLTLDAASRIRGFVETPWLTPASDGQSPRLAGLVLWSAGPSHSLHSDSTQCSVRSTSTAFVVHSTTFVV